jgi:uncharacterized protein YdeI (YjbR/CyaY-like superfamily)
MAPVTPDPSTIHAFKSPKAFETWLAKNHAKQSELYLRIYKKDSGVATVTYAEALDVALCWGWIDGLKKSYDAESFLQRFTPRKKKSVWSQINRDHVARLIADKRMTPHGLSHVAAAKADGRWDAAYAGAKTMTVPEDLLEAIRAEPKALANYERLDKTNRYALAFRLGNLKTAAGRQKRIESFVEMLKAGGTLHPTKKT